MKLYELHVSKAAHQYEYLTVDQKCLSVNHIDKINMVKIILKELTLAVPQPTVACIFLQ